VNGLFGAYGSGKTWAALVTAAGELAAGNVVVYVDFEDDEVGIVGRLLGLGVDPEAIKRGLRYVHPDAAPTDDEYRALLKLAKTASLVVVDSVGEWLGLAGVEGNSDAQVAEWTQRYVKRLAREGAAVLLLDHMPHDDRNERHVMRAIGSQRKMAAVTGAAFRVAEVEPPGRGRRGVVQLVAAKDRHGHWGRRLPAADLVLDATGEGEGVAAELRPPRAIVTPETDDLLLALHRAGETGLTDEEAATALVGTGWRPRTFTEQTTAAALDLAARRAARREMQRFVAAALATYQPPTRGGPGGGAAPGRWRITAVGRARAGHPEEAEE